MIAKFWLKNTCYSMPFIKVSRIYSLTKNPQFRKHHFSDDSKDIWNKWEYDTSNILSPINKDRKYKIKNNLSEYSNKQNIKLEKFEYKCKQMSINEISKCISILYKICPISRWNKLLSALQYRSSKLRFIFENPGNLNNVWAAIRTIDAFGYQYVDICLEKNHPILLPKKDEEINPKIYKMTSALGTQKWLSLNYSDNILTLIKTMKNNGKYI